MKKALSILSICLVLCAGLLLNTNAHAALSNQNNAHMLCKDLGSPSVDDAVILMGSTGKKLVVTAVSLYNEAAIAASDTNYVVLELKKGSTVVAEIDSRAAHENGIAQNAKEALNLVSAELTIAADALLQVDYDETDAGTNVALTNAVLCMDYYVK